MLRMRRDTRLVCVVRGCSILLREILGLLVVLKLVDHADRGTDWSLDLTL